MKTLPANIGKLVFGIIFCVVLIFLFFGYSEVLNFIISDSGPLSDKPLANTLEIKMFLYEKIIQEQIDFEKWKQEETGIEYDYKIKEFRFMQEPDFDYIAPKLEEKFPDVKIVHGKLRFIKRNVNDELDYDNKFKNDELDYDNMFEDNVSCHQLGEIKLFIGRKIQVEQVNHRGMLASSGYTHVFRKKGKYWFYYGTTGIEWMTQLFFNKETRFFEAVAAR